MFTHGELNAQNLGKVTKKLESIVADLDEMMTSARQSEQPAAIAMLDRNMRAANFMIGEIRNETRFITVVDKARIVDKARDDTGR